MARVMDQTRTYIRIADISDDSWPSVDVGLSVISSTPCGVGPAAAADAVVAAADAPSQRGSSSSDVSDEESSGFFNDIVEDSVETPQLESNEESAGIDTEANEVPDETTTKTGSRDSLGTSAASSHFDQSNSSSSRRMQEKRVNEERTGRKEQANDRQRRHQREEADETFGPIAPKPKEGSLGNTDNRFTCTAQVNHGFTNDDNDVFAPEDTASTLGPDAAEASFVRDDALTPPSWRLNSESDESVYYDTINSTCSSANILKRAAADIASGKATANRSGTVMLRPSSPPDAAEATSDSPEMKTTGSKPSLLDLQIASSGRALLHRSLAQVKKRLENLSPTVFPSGEGMPSPQDSARKLKNSYLKNLVVLSIGFMLAYTAFFSMRNLQSSIHHEEGLGLVSMACLYCSFVVGCFFAASIIHQIRPQRALVISTLGNLAFILANLHPEFYSMIPATLFLGFAMAVMWTAQGTYITSIGVSYAAVSGQPPENVLGLFNGFFIFLLQLAQILGNLMSSTVLNIELRFLESTAENGTGVQTVPNEGLSFREPTRGYDVIKMEVLDGETPVPDERPTPSICGAAYCHSYRIDHGELNVEPHMLRTLVVIYAALSAIATLFMAAFLDKLDVIFHKAKHGLQRQLLAVWSVHLDPNMLLLVAFMTYMGMHEAFIYGEVTKAFITCPLGVHMIGYVMVCFGACDSLTAFLCGQLHRYVHRPVFLTFAAVLDVGLLAFLYVWVPARDQTVVIYVVLGLLGVCDAIWQTQSCNLCGLLFPSKDREAAFASLRMYESLGFAIAFAYSQFLCMGMKIAIVGSLLGVAMVTYYITEIVNSRKEKERRSTAFV